MPTRKSWSHDSVVEFAHENSLVAVLVLLGIEQLDRRAWHDSRNGMLVDQLRLRIAAQQKAEIVKPGDHALQFDTIHEEDCDWHLLLADVIEKGVLKILES